MSMHGLLPHSAGQRGSARRLFPLLGLFLMLAGRPGWALPLILEVDARRPPVSPQEFMTRGQRLENGIGAPQDLDLAIGSYCVAARLEHADARYHLGWLYLSGRLGKVDEVLAAAWFKQAQALGHQRAQQQLRGLQALDLSLEGELAQAPPCVIRDSMVARRIADLRPPPEAPASAPGPGTPPEDQRPRLREIGPQEIIALVERLAPDFRLEPSLVLAVIEAESNFNLEAQSPKNAQGLMQLIPATADRFGVANVWDPVQNLKGGMAYLRWLLDHFDGDLELALAGYNAGEQAVARHGGVPPYPETQAYVKRIQRRLGLAAGVKSRGEQATGAKPTGDLSTGELSTGPSHTGDPATEVKSTQASWRGSAGNG